MYVCMLTYICIYKYIYICNCTAVFKLCCCSSSLGEYFFFLHPLPSSCKLVSEWVKEWRSCAAKRRCYLRSASGVSVDLRERLRKHWVEECTVITLIISAEILIFLLFYGWGVLLGFAVLLLRCCCAACAASPSKLQQQISYPYPSLSCCAQPHRCSRSAASLKPQSLVVSGLWCRFSACRRFAVAHLLYCILYIYLYLYSMCICIYRYRYRFIHICIYIYTHIYICVETAWGDAVAFGLTNY